MQYYLGVLLKIKLFWLNYCVLHSHSGKPGLNLHKTTQQYINSDLIRASEDELVELMRTPRRLYIHGGVNDDPEAAAHHFPALTIGGEGDPAFLDTLLSYYN